MKILLTSDWYPTAINGVVASVMNLKAALELEGHDVRLLTLNTKNKTDLKEGNIYALGSISVNRLYPNARFNTHMMSHLIRELIDWHPDIVHSNCEFSTFPVALHIASKCKVPLIHTYHTVYEDYTHYFSPSEHIGKRVVVRFTRLIASQVDGMIVPTEKVHCLLESYRVQTPLYTIPSGIRLEKFQTLPTEEWILDKKNRYQLHGKITLLYLGRLAKEKRVDQLIETMVHLPSHVALLIVGGGPEEEHLRALTSHLNLEDRVRFTGMVRPEETASYYRLGDCFVSASTSETQGLTYIEALSCSLPLLCRKDDCLTGVIEDGVNGFQWKTQEDFLDRLQPLLSPEVRKQYSEASQRLSQKFSTQVFAASAMEAYEDCLRRGPKAKGIFRIRSRLASRMLRIRARVEESLLIVEKFLSR